MEFTMTTRGAPALVLNGFKYVVNRKNASGKIWTALAFVPIRFDSIYENWLCRQSDTKCRQSKTNAPKVGEMRVGEMRCRRSD